MNELSIYSQGLNKDFISTKKAPGLKGSFQSFFKRNPITKKAVCNFDLQVKKGEIIGLLGPNGAGKTTLMKMFTGIIVPTSGELTILGHRPWERDKSLRKKIALVMGQKSQLWWDIPAMDSFLLLQKYYEVGDQDFHKRIKEMGDLLGVSDLLHIHVRKLSLGERMKMELMASLLHNPQIIFLDEPTIGLDLMAQENTRQFIKNYHQTHDCTLVITSHYMADVQALCERLVLIFDGQKGFDGHLSEFEQILGNEKNLTFRFTQKQNPHSPFWNSLGLLGAQWSPDYLQMETSASEKEIRLISLKILKEIPVSDFYTEKMPIEKVMKTLIQNPQILKQKK